MVTRRPGLTALLAALLGGVAATALAACTVDRGRYRDQVYSCDVRAPDPAQECGDGWVCHPGSQLGTFDYCAPACTASDATSFCSPDGARMTTCAPTAGTSCDPGMECLRTSITADEGLCLPVEVCADSADCRDPVRNQCLSRVLFDAYRGAVAVDNMWCLQGDCNELSPCEAGHSCLGGLPLLQQIPPICTPNCGHDDLCPRSFVCASQVLAALPYRFCLPGLYGFPCASDDHCLMGTCQPLGSNGKACTVPCSSDTQCQDLYRPAAASESTTAAVACIEGQCITAFSLIMPLLCSPSADRCPAGAECVTSQDAGDAGVPEEAAVGEYMCRKQCPEGPRQCQGFSTARGCLNVLGYTACFPGIAWPAVECDPADADACLKGLQCLKPPAGNHFCTIACETDPQCASHPWLPKGWSCRGAAGAKVCVP